MKPFGSVLFVDDDDTGISRLIHELSCLEPLIEYLSISVESRLAAALQQHSPEVLIVDLNLDPLRGPVGGLEVIAQAHRRDPSLRIIALTGYDAATYGVQALHRGAASFIEKPANLDYLLALIRDGICYSQLKRSYLQSNRKHLNQSIGITSQSKAMSDALEQLAYAATTKQPVLLIGETGVGKGVLTHALHQASKQAKKRLVRLPASFGSHDLVASELFGHERGSFTGATSTRHGLIQEAHGGILFIDEVDQLPAETQVLLLDTLQTKLYRSLGSNKTKHSDFRLVAATNRAEDELLGANGLREDFYHRIAHCTIRIPALRDRREDIPLLAEEFLHALVRKERLSIQGLTPEALNYLSGFAWPGNVRQLQAVVEGAVYRAAYERLRFVEVFHLEIRHTTTSKRHGSFRSQVHSFEERLVRQALADCNNNQSQAAKVLQLDRSSLRRIMHRSR